MSSEVMEQGKVSVTQFAGFCEACGDRGRTYQLTGAKGYVSVCSGCLHTIFFAVEAAEQDSISTARAVARNSKPGEHPRCFCTAEKHEEYCPIHGQDIR